MNYLSILMIIIFIILSIRGIIIFIYDIIKMLQDKMKKRRLIKILEEIRKDLF